MSWFTRKQPTCPPCPTISESPASIALKMSFLRSLRGTRKLYPHEHSALNYVKKRLDDGTPGIGDDNIVQNIWDGLARKLASNPRILETVDPAMAPTMDPAMAPTVDPAMAPTVDPAMAPAVDPAMAPTVENLPPASEAVATQPTLEQSTEAQCTPLNVPDHPDVELLRANPGDMQKKNQLDQILAGMKKENKTIFFNWGKNPAFDSNLAELLIKAKAVFLSNWAYLVRRMVTRNSNNTILYFKTSNALLQGGFNVDMFQYLGHVGERPVLDAAFKELLQNVIDVKVCKLKVPKYVQKYGANATLRDIIKTENDDAGFYFDTLLPLAKGGTRRNVRSRLRSRKPVRGKQLKKSVHRNARTRR